MNKTNLIDALKNDMPLTDFIRGVNKKLNDYWHRNNFTHNDAPVIMIDSVGKRYAKPAQCERVPHHTGPLKATGDLLKGTWKAPVANGVRGNVKDPNVLDKFTEHGPAYLRR